MLTSYTAEPGNQSTASTHGGMAVAWLWLTTRKLIHRQYGGMVGGTSARGPQRWFSKVEFSGSFRQTCL